MPMVLSFDVSLNFSTGFCFIWRSPRLWCVTVIIISHINLLDDIKKSGISNKDFLSLVFNYLLLSVVESIRLYILLPAVLLLAVPATLFGWDILSGFSLLFLTVLTWSRGELWDKKYVFSGVLETDVKIDKDSKTFLIDHVNKK